MNLAKRNVILGTYKIYEVGSDKSLTYIGMTHEDGVTITVETDKKEVINGITGAIHRKYVYTKAAYAEFKIMEVDGNAIKRALPQAVGTAGEHIDVTQVMYEMKEEATNYVLKFASDEEAKELHIHLWQACNDEDFSAAFTKNSETSIGYKMQCFGSSGRFITFGGVDL